MTTPPDHMIAVFESRPYWGPELQRQFLHSVVAVRECRSTQDLLSSVQESPSVLFVLDLDAGLTNCVAWLGSIKNESSIPWPIVAIGSSSLSHLEWSLRDAGVTAFVTDLIPGNDLAQLCRRQLGLGRERHTTK